MREDPYIVLGVSRDASDEEIRSAYRGLARQLHPDASGLSETADGFRRATEAYEALRRLGKIGDGGVPIPIRRGPAPRQSARAAEPLRTSASRRSDPLAASRSIGRTAEPLRRPDPAVEPLGAGTLRPRRASAPPPRPPGLTPVELAPLLWLLELGFLDE